jgi:glycosyltransferase involved in cell wall biosynthesis
MACGRAVITSAAGGAGELVDPGVDAVTHAPGNVQALAAAIERLAGDRALRQRLGAAGHARAARDFNHERLAHALIPIYRRTLVARGAAPGAAA